MRYQSHAARAPWDTQRTEWKVIIDYRESRMRRDFIERYPKDFEFVGRQIFTPTGGFRIDPTRRNAGDAMQRFANLNFERARNGIDWDVPALLVGRALNRPATLRSGGSVLENGRRLNVVSFADQDGTLITLLFDEATGLLSRYERLRDDGMEGDMVVAVEFHGYAARRGITVPTRRIETHNGEIVREGTLAFEFDTRPLDSLYAEPSGYEEPAPRAEERQPVRQLADGVWIIQRLGNRVMFVEMAEYVLVFETPLPQASATAVMEIVRTAVPAKPIRYVTFSHHHDDHAGGLRPYIAEGITIVTTPASMPLVERVVAATHTIAPDTLSALPRKPVVELFRGVRVFEDSTRRVELHELGPNSHVDEMILAWLPGERIVFQGDLLILPDQGDVPSANQLSEEFLAKIENMKWPVETIAGVHGRVGTLDDLRTAVAKRRALRSPP